MAKIIFEDYSIDRELGEGEPTVPDLRPKCPFCPSHDIAPFDKKDMHCWDCGRVWPRRDVC